jgi:hypothetical protein
VIDLVREPVLQGHLASTAELCLFDETHQRMLAIQPIKTILDGFRVRAEGGRDNDRVEVGSLHGRCRQQAVVRLLERVHLALNQAADRGRQLALEGRQILGDDPLVVLAAKNLPPLEIAQQVGHEQRVALGARRNQGGKSRWKFVVRELQRDVPIDGGLGERAGRDFDALAACQEIEFQPEEPMPRLGQR